MGVSFSALRTDQALKHCFYLLAGLVICSCLGLANCPASSVCQSLNLSCSFQLVAVIIQKYQMKHRGKGLCAALRPQWKQQWELCLSEKYWVTYLHLSSAPGEPPWEGQRGFSMMKGASQPGRSAGIGLNRAKAMSQLHPGFHNLTLSFLFAPLSCSLSLIICVFTKYCIKYLLARLSLRHLFLRGKELCATVLQMEDKNQSRALANWELFWLNLHNCSEFLFVLWQETTLTLSFFCSTSHQHYILHWTVIQHLSLMRVPSSWGLSLLKPQNSGHRKLGEGDELP